MSEEQPSGFQQEMERMFQEFEQALKEDNVEKASTVMNGIWVMFQIMCAAASSPTLKELTYLKAPFSFDNGGKYLLTLIHVDGPKIQLQGPSGNAYTKKFEEIK